MHTAPKQESYSIIFGLYSLFIDYLYFFLKIMSKKVFYSLGFLNISSHDPAACLFKCDLSSGSIKSEYIHFDEGMLSRKKKSYLFPIRSINRRLDHFKIQCQILT